MELSAFWAHQVKTIVQGVGALGMSFTLASPTRVVYSFEDGRYELTCLSYGNFYPSSKTILHFQLPISRAFLLAWKTLK